MFGYVTPCPSELKLKDYEKFKAYYCGLCLSIKKNYGELPRLTLNYDMTFLAILLDALDNTKASFIKRRCTYHMFQKKLFIENNLATDYAAFCNITLAHYKLLDNVQDEKNLKSKISSLVFTPYMKKNILKFNALEDKIKLLLNELNNIEDYNKATIIDELANPFAKLTGEILCYYKKDAIYNEDLYKLGYYLGKYIYIIDAYDDLEKDMKKNKYNALVHAFNKDNLQFNEFKGIIEKRVDNILVNCAYECSNYLKALPLGKNKDILTNILEFGLMEKLDKVFKRSECENEKSI